MYFAKIDIAATADVVAAVAGRRIRVLAGLLVAAGSVTATWKSGSTGLTGAMSMVVGVPLPMAPSNSMDTVPHLQTAAGEALNLTLSGAVQVSGYLVYDLVG